MTIKNSNQSHICVVVQRRIGEFLKLTIICICKIVESHTQPYGVVFKNKPLIFVHNQYNCLLVILDNLLTAYLIIEISTTSQDRIYSGTSI